MGQQKNVSNMTHILYEIFGTPSISIIENWKPRCISQERPRRTRPIAGGNKKTSPIHNCRHTNESRECVFHSIADENMCEKSRQCGGWPKRLFTVHKIELFGKYTYRKKKWVACPWSDCQSKGHLASKKRRPAPTVCWISFFLLFLSIECIELNS